MDLEASQIVRWLIEEQRRGEQARNCAQELEHFVGSRQTQAGERWRLSGVLDKSGPSQGHEQDYEGHKSDRDQDHRGSRAPGDLVASQNAGD